MCLLLHLYPFSHSVALLPLPFVAQQLHLLDNELKDIPILVPFLELVLDLLTCRWQQIPSSPCSPSSVTGWVVEEDGMESSMVHNVAHGVSASMGG